jgi:hypothetical protein
MIAFYDLTILRFYDFTISQFHDFTILRFIIYPGANLSFIVYHFSIGEAKKARNGVFYDFLYSWKGLISRKSLFLPR